MDADFLIVGGGPIGLGAAMVAAKAGCRVRVIERAHGPVDKACGEGLMPPAVAWLRRTGIDVPAWGQHRFRGIRYIDRELTVEGDFPDGEGLGVRRLALSEGFRRRALELGVEIEEGEELSGISPSSHGVALTLRSGGRREARFLLGADGLHSTTRRLLGVEVTRGPALRHGIRQHFTGRPWSDHVEVWWGDRAEAYVTPVGPERVGIALLWSGGPARFDTLLAAFPALRERLGPAESAPRGAGPFDLRVSRRVIGPAVLIGDAAGYLDAITGEGIALGLEQAEAAVHLCLAGKISVYEAEWWRLSRRHRLLTRLLLAIGRRPKLRRRIFRALAQEPAAFGAFLGLNTGTTSLATVLARSWRLPLRLLAG